MSALDNAEQHLTQALSRLEQALAQRMAAADPDHAAAIARLSDERDRLQHDVQSLRQECDRLTTALQSAEQDRDAARRMTHEVASRLDVSIEELDRLIEE